MNYYLENGARPGILRVKAIPARVWVARPMVVHGDCSKRSTNVKDESLKIQHELAKTAAILLAFAVGGWWLGGPLGAILAIAAVPRLPVRADFFSGLGMLLTPAKQFVADILSLAPCRHMKIL